MIGVALSLALLASSQIRTLPDGSIVTFFGDQSVTVGNWHFDRRLDSFSGQYVCTTRHIAAGEPTLTVVMVDKFFVLSGFPPFETAEVRIDGQNVQTMTPLAYYGRERQLVIQLNRAGGLAIQQADLPKMRTMAVRVRGIVANLNFEELRNSSAQIPPGC